MITLISTPDYHEPLNTAIVDRWVATESPNNFRFQRQDFIIDDYADNGSFMQFHSAVPYNGNIDNEIAIYDSAANQVLVGKIISSDGGDYWTTSIPYNVAYVPTYLNDNTLHGGYYVEGRMTVNNIVSPLPIIASPDCFGYADLDVSGILRVSTTIGKDGDYTSRIMSEPSKSGKFSLEYRECWYGSSEVWHQAEGVGSPESVTDWFYVQAVRSEEQGSNLQEFVANAVKDAPFMNSFDRPIYFRGLPFDLSFIDPEFFAGSPGVDLDVTIDSYDSEGFLINHFTETVATGLMDGFLNSLLIDDAIIPVGAYYFTAEIAFP